MAAAVTQTGAHAEAKAEGRPFGWYGMVFFLASEAFFFANLIAAYLYLRVEHGAPFADKDKLNIPLVIVNTVILVSSSFVLTWAVGGLRRGNNRRLAIGVILTALMGLIFLSVQAFEYMALGNDGLTPQSSIFGSAFFTLTGFHFAHVSFGVLLLLVAFFRSTRGHFTEQRHFGLTATEMYWHFVDVVWVVLFLSLYILP
jgi:heme/copper-type cytochrome/quinol oxidase subunit 3